MYHLCYLCLVFVMLSSLLQCCLVVTCWERTYLLARICDVCVFVIFPCILGQVWYLIVSIPDLCHLSYFYLKKYVANVVIP